MSDGTHHDIGVEKIILSPYYNPRTLNNDIALMKLKTPVVFGKYVKPVCLPNQDQNFPVGTQCYITGMCYFTLIRNILLALSCLLGVVTGVENKKREGENTKEK